jgi:cytochrome c oxidase cbb3-type subunit 1
VYVAALTVGGVLQGWFMNDPKTAFVDVVQLTRPYLTLRSLSGILMTAGHLLFAYLFARLLLRQGPATAEGGLA